MKGIVIYYSITGNTKKVANAIYKGMSQKMEQCDIVSLKEADPNILNEYDLIGIGSLVWGADPIPVRKFINSIPISNGKHVFCFCTHDAAPKLYFPVVTHRLRKRGFTVIGMRDWYGEIFTQSFPYPWHTDGHPDDIDLKEAQDFGKEIVEISERISAGETDLIPLEMPLPDEITQDKEYYIREERSPHGTIKYNKEKCLYPKCHICVDNCPMGYIDLEEPRLFGERPHIAAKCDTTCTLCELLCPTGAIYSDDFEWGLDMIRKLNPEFEKLLDEAEKEGHFRRLVARDKIGWDTPRYKVFNKRPRYKMPKDD